MEDHQKKKLLIRYFSGQTTPLEDSVIESRMSDPEFREYFFEILEDWERTHPQFIPDQEKALERLEQSFSESRDAGHHNDRADKKTMKSYFWVWRSVAGVLLIGLLAFFFKETLLYKTYRADYGDTRTVRLSDGSVVDLNANSTLRVSRWMNWQTVREVWVTGEAYFSVKSTADRRCFLVHTPQLNVEVLGTKFNIKDRDKSAKVVLQEGKVRVRCNEKDKGIALLENTGEVAELNIESDKMVTRRVDPSFHTVWKEKKLKFEEAYLSVVLESIREYYGVDIISSDTALLQRKFSGTLPNDNLDIILRSLKNIYDSEFTPEVVHAPGRLSE